VKEIGTAPIMVKENIYCSECGRVHDFEICPDCMSSIAIGYGFMFGGFGLYKLCLNDSCNWFWKRLEEEDD